MEHTGEIDYKKLAGMVDVDIYAECFIFISTKRLLQTEISMIEFVGSLGFRNTQSFIDWMSERFSLPYHGNLQPIIKKLEKEVSS